MRAALPNACVPQSKLESASLRSAFHWVGGDTLVQTAIATAISFFVYTGHSYLQFPITEGVGAGAHQLTGVILGLLLVARVVMGVYLVHSAGVTVQAFHKCCRSIAVLSSTVSETLTVSAGAEIEKKAATKFRYELVRLLNLAFYCYQLMLQGLKLYVPPASLRAPEGSKLEGEVLSAVDNPTVMVCKMLADLLEQQRAAKRISNEGAAMLMAKLSEMLDSYHATLALVFAPPPVALSSFTTFFTRAWAYSAGAVIAVLELADNTGFHAYGLMCTLVYTAAISLFIFGLYEAGKCVEAPLKTLVTLSVAEDMMASLSDDLASLVADPSVPVFIPKH